MSSVIDAYVKAYKAKLDKGDTHGADLVKEKAFNQNMDAYYEIVRLFDPERYQKLFQDEICDHSDQEEIQTKIYRCRTCGVIMDLRGTISGEAC